jgi:2-iminobutanoate/2-iminopropanoate deaminase
MSKHVILTKDAPAPIGPYSQAIRTGGMVFVSGQIAINPANGNLETADIVSETTQVMKNIGGILKEAGLSYVNIVKASIFVKDLSNFGIINETYGKYFFENEPARETVEVSRLPKDVNVEISVIAVDF